nr:MAG TPA: hypothetical protein [Caudoviricetes sp.]
MFVFIIAPFSFEGVSLISFTCVSHQFYTQVSPRSL